MDVTKPFYLVFPALVSMILCHLYFYELSEFVLLNGLYSLALFFIFSHFISFGIIPSGWLRGGEVNELITSAKNFKLIFFCLVVFCYLGSAGLVYTFSSKFGFLTIFRDPSLLQKNAITNSLGYLLYMNIMLVPVFLALSVKDSKLYFFFFVLSVFFLLFAGIKSYIFQSIALTFLVFSQGRPFFQLLMKFTFVFVGLFTIFVGYDFFLDSGAPDLEKSSERFLAYFSGSWGTFSHYNDEGWGTPYPGLTVLYPIYKIFSFGGVSLADYTRFYEINGFNLNVVPVFQLAYLEGGWLFQTVFTLLLSFIYVTLRHRASKARSNIFHKLIFYFFCSSFVISSLFANIFADLTFWLSIFAFSFLGFFVKQHYKVFG